MSWVTKRIVRPSALEPVELVEALLLEGGVADGEHLVDQQDLGVDLDRDREREAHVHAGGVVLQPQVEEVLELGEGDDRRRSARAPACGVSPSMIALIITLSRAVRSMLKPTPSSMNGDSRPRTRARRCRCRRSRRGTSAACSCRSRCGPRCRRTRPGDLDADVVDGLQHVERARAERMQRPLLERVVLLVGEPEGLADAHDRHRGWPRRRRARRRDGQGCGGVAAVVKDT